MAHLSEDEKAKLRAALAESRPLTGVEELNDAARDRLQAAAHAHETSWDPIRDAMRRHPSAGLAHPPPTYSRPGRQVTATVRETLKATVPEMAVHQHHPRSPEKSAALNVAYLEAAAAGIHVHEYGPGGLARADNCPPGCTS